MFCVCLDSFQLPLNEHLPHGFRDSCQPQNQEILLFYQLLQEIWFLT
jgi:hypothetical protein